MKITYETVNLLMILMPGLLSSGIFNLIRRNTEPSPFNKIIESFLFTFLVYVAVNLTYGWQPIAQAVSIGGNISYVFSADIYLILLTLLYSITLPLLWGSIVHYDCHMKLLRVLKITDRTSRETAWDDVFTDEKRFLTVHLTDERRVTGWPLYYSNNKDEGFIYLTKAAWISDSNEYIDTDSHGLLIKRDMIDLIEFMNYKEKTEEQK